MTKLTEKDHEAMDKMLGKMLDAYKNGDISKKVAVLGLAHIMAALDKGNTGEAVAWFNQNNLEYFKDAN
ncbi:MAG: hypothetical protein LBV45_07080 [Xanthomonadaceae bacterium]|jgi:hypothetical protein|nr:hypothetical protein [Xanthomonadaceae bacterium]